MKNNKVYLASSLVAISVGFSGIDANASGLMEVYKISLNSDPVLKQVIATKNSIKEGKSQAYSAFLPSVSATADTTELFPRDDSNNSHYNNTSVGISLHQSIYDKRNYVINRISKLNVSSANADLVQAEQDLMSRVTNAYLDVLLAADTVEFTKSEKVAIGRQLEQSKRRYEVGIIAITDVLEAQAGFDSATASVLKAENDYQISREKLRDIAGQYFEDLSPVIDNMPLDPPQPSNINTWVEYAIETNPALQSVNFKKKSSKENIVLQRSGHYPSLALLASYKETKTDSNNLFTTDGGDGSIALQLKFPIYQGGFVSSKTRQAHSDLEVISNREEEIKRTTERATRSSYLSVVSEISRVKALKQAVISNESAIKATEAGFEVGTRTIVDVLNVQRDRFEAKRNYSEARYNFIRATVFLKQSAGLLEEKDLATIDKWLKN